MNKKYLLGVLALLVFVPQVTFAVWWNPGTWFNNWSFHKIEVSPLAQVETQKKPEEKIDQSQNKQIDFTTTIKTPSKPAVSSDTVSISKQKAGEISTTDLFKVIDNLIDDYNSSISSYTEIQDFANTRIDTISQLKEKMLSVLKIETDSCSKDWDEWVLDVLDKEEKYQKSVIDSSSQMIKLSKNQIDGLKKFRDIIPEYMDKEAFLSSYNKLKELYKDIDAFKKDISTTNESQRIVIEKSLSMWDQWKTNSDSCSSQYTENYDTIRSYNYRPAVIPQIRIPKTTYCTMGLMSGTQSYYSITCN